MARYLLFVLILTTIGCNPRKQPNETSSLNESNSLPAQKILNDTTLLKNYRALLAGANKQELVFLKELISTIKSFSTKELDTTVISVGKIDSDNITDTIKSRVFKLNSDIIVQSSWSKGERTYWSYTIKNPYLWISDNNLFDPQSRSFWVTFTIGFFYAVPEIENIQKYSNLLDISYETGIKSLEASGINVDRDKYRKYLSNFKNDLVSWGHPEAREGLYIWYEPQQKFVLFYHE